MLAGSLPLSGVRPGLPARVLQKRLVLVTDEFDEFRAVYHGALEHPDAKGLRIRHRINAVEIVRLDHKRVAVPSCNGVTVPGRSHRPHGRKRAAVHVERTETVIRL